MPKTLQSPRQEALCAFLVLERKKAGLTQADVAKKLGEHQSFVARLESGERRIDVVEFIRLAEIIGFSARSGIAMIEKIKL